MMKRVKGGIKVVKGQIAMNTHGGAENRIQLFDGKFTTGYRITEFRICPKSPQNQEEVMAVVSTEPRGGVPSTIDFSSNIEVAYSFWNVPNQVDHSSWNWVIPDNMAIQDLWVSNYTTGDDTHLNYYLILEKYEFAAWDGAATLVRNQSQAGPSE